MSIRNLLTDNLKNDQNLKIHGLEVINLEIENLTVENLTVNNLKANNIQLASEYVIVDYATAQDAIANFDSGRIFLTNVGNITQAQTITFRVNKSDINVSTVIQATAYTQDPQTRKLTFSVDDRDNGFFIVSWTNNSPTDATNTSPAFYYTIFNPISP